MESRIRFKNESERDEMVQFAIMSDRSNHAERISRMKLIMD